MAILSPTSKIRHFVPYDNCSGVRVTSSEFSSQSIERRNNVRLQANAPYEQTKTLDTSEAGQCSIAADYVQSNAAVGLSKHRPLAEMTPRGSYNQRWNTEVTFRSTVRFGDHLDSHRSRAQLHSMRTRRITAWILIAAIGFTSVVAFYLLWARA
jgi:hypothetical protein